MTFSEAAASATTLTNARTAGEAAADRTIAITLASRRPHALPDRGERQLPSEQHRGETLLHRADLGSTGSTSLGGPST